MPRTEFISICSFSAPHTKGKNRGFTIVEILVAVLIVGILAGMLVFSTAAPLEKSDEIVCQANRRTLMSALNVERASSGVFNITSTDLEKAIDNCDIKHRVTYSISPYNNNAVIDGMCQSGGSIGLFWYLVDGKEQKWILCTEHIDKNVDPTARYRFETLWLQFLAANPNPYTNDDATTKLISKWKSDLYTNFYKGKEGMLMDQDYYDNTIKTLMYNSKTVEKMYWWDYPVTDSKGNVLYTVTYANGYGNSNWWNDSSNRGRIGQGWVVVVDGVTYIRRKSSCVEPGRQDSFYQTKQALIDAMVNAGYTILQ